MINTIFKLSVLVALASLFGIGCAGPEQKFSRGLRNVTEFARLSEMQRSIEQSALWDGPQATYSSGVVRGFNRTLARTVYGAWEVATFPFPSYEAKFTPKGYVAPDNSIGSTRFPYGGMKLTELPSTPNSNKPGMPTDPIMDASSDLGFNGGVIGRWVPGSRFRVFEGF